MKKQVRWLGTYWRTRGIVNCRQSSIQCYPLELKVEYFFCMIWRFQVLSRVNGLEKRFWRIYLKLQKAQVFSRLGWLMYKTLWGSGKNTAFFLSKTNRGVQVTVEMLNLCFPNCWHNSILLVLWFPDRHR